MSTSQLKLALTRDPRASAIVRPVTKVVSTPEAKKLPKLLCTENVGKASLTQRTLPSSSSSSFSSYCSCFYSSPGQSILKIVPAILNVEPDSVHPSKDSAPQQLLTEGQNTKTCSSSQNSLTMLLPPTNSPLHYLHPPTLNHPPHNLHCLHPPQFLHSLPPNLFPPPVASPKPPVASPQPLPTSKPPVPSSQLLPTTKSPVTASSQLIAASSKLSSTTQLLTTGSVKSSPLPIILHQHTSKHLTNYKEDKPSLVLSSCSPAVLSTTLSASVQSVVSSSSPAVVSTTLPTSVLSVVSSSSPAVVSTTLSASVQSLVSNSSPAVVSTTLPTSVLSVVSSSSPAVVSTTLPASVQSVVSSSSPAVVSTTLPTSVLSVVNSSSSAVISTTLPASVQSVLSVDEPPQPKKVRRQSMALLPVSRVRTIMKAKLQPLKTGQQLGKDSVPIITKAAELFIAVLVQDAEKCADVGGNEVTYKQLATSVNRQSKLQFLHEILPKKVVAKDYLPSQ